MSTQEERSALRLRELEEIVAVRNREIAHLERELQTRIKRKNRKIMKLELELFHETRRSEDLDHRWFELASDYERVCADLDRTGAVLHSLESHPLIRVLRKLRWIARGMPLRNRLRARTKAVAPTTDADTSTPIVLPTSTTPVASILVIAWRDAPHLRACLTSVVEHVHHVPYEVILIMNEPSDALSSFVAEMTTGLTTVVTRVNVGYGGAVNLGAKRARGEFIVLLNDDATVEEDWLEQLVETARRRPAAGAVGSTTLFLDGTIQEAGSVIWRDGSSIKVGRDLAHGVRDYEFERPVDHCSGTSLLVRRSLWEEIDGMDADAYYPAYYEDTDICLRIIEHGSQVWYQPRSVVRHIESASTESLFRRFLFEKNQAVFVRRWAARLATHVSPGKLSVVEINEALWRAMGRPVRVLVIGEPNEFAHRLGFSLIEDPRVHFTLLAPSAPVENKILCRQGVAVIDAIDPTDLRPRLVSGELRFDLIVDLHPEENSSLGELVTKACSRTPICDLGVADGASVPVHLSRWGSSEAPKSWSSLIECLVARDIAAQERERSHG